jgi:hypothetical protein
VLQRGIASGEFRPVDPDVMTQVLIAPVLMLMMWSRSIMPACEMPPVDPHVFLDTFISTTLVGLRRPSRERRLYFSVQLAIFAGSPP